mmetsp:Transcript_27670/g.77376  ORF Transcript_27670/g.77376 Transcript_27670/m.77376 type:complete len:209 (-) Transcript_27670:238-864(-)
MLRGSRAPPSRPFTAPASPCGPASAAAGPRTPRCPARGALSSPASSPGLAWALDRTSLRATPAATPSCPPHGPGSAPPAPRPPRRRLPPRGSWHRLSSSLPGAQGPEGLALGGASGRPSWPIWRRRGTAGAPQPRWRPRGWCGSGGRRPGGGSTPATGTPRPSPRGTSRTAPSAPAPPPRCPGSSARTPPRPPPSPSCTPSGRIHTAI